MAQRPADEIRGPEIPMGPGRSPQIPAAQDDETEFVPSEPEAPEGETSKDKA